MASISEPLPPPPPITGVEPLEVSNTAETDAVLPGGATQDSSTDAADRTQAVVESAKGWGMWILGKLEAAGEFVAGVLGLDESKYQYVIDSMTEQDWKIARMTEQRRLAAIAARSVENMEGGSSGVGQLGKEGQAAPTREAVIPGVLGKEMAIEAAAAAAAAAVPAEAEASRT